MPECKHLKRVFSSAEKSLRYTVLFQGYGNDPKYFWKCFQNLKHILVNIINGGKYLSFEEIFYV